MCRSVQSKDYIIQFLHLKVLEDARPGDLGYKGGLYPFLEPVYWTFLPKKAQSWLGGIMRAECTNQTSSKFLKVV